jgi:DNA-binding response OmpR family regulator
MLNRSCVVLAENDMDISQATSDSLIRLGGYKVVPVTRCDEVAPALRSTAAAWLILDLELDDGWSDEHIADWRREFPELFIIVLTGHADTRSEDANLQRGATLAMRKPYTARALVMQMQQLSGISTRTMPAQPKLLCNGWTIDLSANTLTRGEESQTLSELSGDLLRLLCTCRDENGVWQKKPVQTLWLSLYSSEGESDSDRYANNLRVLIHRLEKRIDAPIIEVLRGGNNRSSFYRLASDVTLLTEEENTPTNIPKRRATDSP